MLLYQQDNVNKSDSKEAIMRKLILMFEDIWVAVSFAEAGVVYNPSVENDLHPQCQDTLRIHAA